MECSVLSPAVGLLSGGFDLFCRRNAERRRPAHGLPVAAESRRNLPLGFLPLGRGHRRHQFRQAFRRLSPVAPGDFGVV